MHRLICCFVILGLAACTIGSTGCSSGKTTLDTEYVEGVVTLDGDPVAGATVTFQPVTEGQGMSATGKTDENGVYKLTAVPTGDETAEPLAGTLPGEYYVGVSKVSFAVDEEHEEEGSAAAAGKPTDEGEEAGDDGVTVVVPEKYNNPSESGIQVTVEEGENDIPIELTSGG